LGEAAFRQRHKQGPGGGFRRGLQRGHLPRALRDYRGDRGQPGQRPERLPDPQRTARSRPTTSTWWTTRRARPDGRGAPRWRTSSWSLNTTAPATAAIGPTLAFLALLAIFLTIGLALSSTSIGLRLVKNLFILGDVIFYISSI
jgi:hypothetical protein